MPELARQVVNLLVAGVGFVGEIEVSDGDMCIRVPFRNAGLAESLARRIEASGATVSKGLMTTAEYEANPYTPPNSTDEAADLEGTPR